MRPSAGGTPPDNTPDLDFPERESDLVYGLRQRVRDLEGLLGLGWKAPRVLRLTKSQEKVLGMVVKRPDLCPYDSIYTALYGDRPDPPVNELVKVHMHHTRKKLRPYSIEIKRLWGFGYSISPENLERLNALYAEGERA